MPADPAVFAAMTWGLAPYAMVPALAFALIWPGSWRWALLLGWGLIAFDAVIAGSELFFASTQPDREAFMAGLNTLVAPLVLFAGMVIAAVAGAWAHSAFAESRRR
jgi:ABC-type Na+ efflux pump permease subunit